MPHWLPASSSTALICSASSRVGAITSATGLRPAGGRQGRVGQGEHGEWVSSRAWRGCAWVDVWHLAASWVAAPSRRCTRQQRHRRRTAAAPAVPKAWRSLRPPTTPPPPPTHPPTCDDSCLPLCPDVAHGWQAKGQRLARAGGGDADQVAPAERDGQALGLDGGGVLEGAGRVQLLGRQACRQGVGGWAARGAAGVGRTAGRLQDNRCWAGGGRTTAPAAKHHFRWQHDTSSSSATQATHWTERRR